MLRYLGGKSGIAAYSKVLTFTGFLGILNVYPYRDIRERRILMETTPNTLLTPSAPTETEDLYPESDGKPVAETDLHIDEIFRMRQILRAYFAEMPDVYVSDNIMMYYEDSRP